MSTMASTGPDPRQECGSPSRYPSRAIGAQILGPSPAYPSSTLARAGSETEQTGLKVTLKYGILVLQVVA